MRIQDRDDVRGHRRFTSSRRTSGPTTLQVAVLWILVGGVAFLLLKDRLPHPPSPPALRAAAPREATSPTMAYPAMPAPTANVTAPPAGYTPSFAAPIYRCGDHYSNDPCNNARVVEGPAATGFDSRPSEKLARLVADGRSIEPTTFTSVTTTNTVSGGRAAECQGLANEIDAIDHTARQPLDAWRQDRLRSERRQARDRQAALHC